MIYARNPVRGVMAGKVNRFLARVKIGGRIQMAHIPNSGRLAELMAPGLEAILEPAENPERKTRFTLKSVKYSGKWVCVDSSIPNLLAEQMARGKAFPVFEGYSSVRREYAIGSHRFDLLLNGPGKKPMIAEVKSVTLVKGGVALFPDAPTLRGASHLRALAGMNGREFARLVIFVIQRSDARVFRPNHETDPDFALALAQAVRAGVSAMAVRCVVGPSNIRAAGLVGLELIE